MLKVEDLSVALSGKSLLSGVSFGARAGQVTAIIGPNGSGKTTLLRALCAEWRYSGHAALNGHDIRTTRPNIMAKLRAALSQETQVAFPFTAGEIVHIGLEAGGHAADEARAAHLLAEVDLPGYAPRPYHQLSGGEQARVQFARALAQVQPVGKKGPMWLLLDEPLASLDIGHQLLVLRIARKFADAGGGVVAVMHDLNLTAMLADQVLLMQSGRLIARGSVPEILSDELLSKAFHCPIRVNTLPAHGSWTLPQSTLGWSGA